MFNFYNSKIVSCLCGNIKFKTKGKLRYVINCHCSQCAKTHGNYAAYTSILENKIFFISKKTLRWFKSSKSSKRGFCYNCGSSIFFKRLKKETISISAGLFLNPTNLITKANIFTKGKR